MQSNEQPQPLRSEKPRPGVEYLYCGETLLAILLRTDFSDEGISFFTDGAFSQQLAHMSRPRGYVIPPHEHNPLSRQIEWTQETLFIRSGRVRVDFYAPDTRTYLASRELGAGDVALLAHGGHGFEMLDPSEIIEVKQGPYAGDADKTRFQPEAGPAAGAVLA